MLKQFPSLEKCSEPVPEEVVSACLSGAFNHEAKGLVTTLFYSGYSESYSASAIAHTLVEEQGESPVWTPSATSITQYCTNSLGRVAGTVVPTTFGKGHESETAWQASPDHYMGKLALAGFTGHWGLQYPDISLQQIYGKTASSTQKQSPELRHRICETIASTEDDLSLIKLIRLLGEPRQRVVGQVDQLVRIGILEKWSIYSEDGVKPIAQRHKRPDERNKLTIAPQAIEPIAALCKGIRDIRQGIDLKAYAELAKDILDSRTDFRTLIEKSRAFSFGAKSASEETTNQQILDILEARDSCRLDDLYLALNKRVQPGTIRVLINKLIDDGKVWRSHSSKSVQYKSIL